MDIEIYICSTTPLLYYVFVLTHFVFNLFHPRTCLGQTEHIEIGERNQPETFFAFLTCFRNTVMASCRFFIADLVSFPRCTVFESPVTSQLGRIYFFNGNLFRRKIFVTLFRRLYGQTVCLT
jgi:hypothetical protein